MHSTRKQFDELTYEIIGAAIDVHKSLGPGLLESVYHHFMKVALEDRCISYETELKVPVEFNGRTIDAPLRCDLFIEKKIVVELKSVQAIIPVHEAQIITYMKLLRAPKGILLNFYCTNLFKEGQRTYVNEYFKQLI